MTFFTEIKKKCVNSYEPTRLQIAEAILSKKNKAGSIILPDFKIYYKTILIKTAWNWHKKQTSRPMEQNSAFIVNSSLTKVPRTHNGRWYSLFKKWCWENLISTCREMKMNPYLIPYAKIDSKWTKDLNIRTETAKLLEENIGKSSMIFWI